MSASLTALAYLIAAVLFVLALRGLSSPVTSRQGNRFGMIGMGVAVVATLAHHGMGGLGYGLIFLGIIIGGAIGTFVALRIQMTALPQLGRGVPFAGGACRGVRRRRGAERARGVRYRHAGQRPYPEPDRDVARTGDRRHHVLRLADRVRQAAGADERRADHVPRPAQAEPRAGHTAGGADRGVRRHRQPDHLLAGRAAGVRTWAS